MKKSIHHLLVLALTISGFSTAYSQDSDYPKLTASLDPMGFLFFGPALNVGYSINHNTVIKANVRAVSLGLLAYSIRANNDDLYDFGGAGYSIGVNRFLENVESGIYYGAFLSLDIQNTKYEENSDFSWHENTKTYGLLVNAGKRIPLGDKFYINAGAVLGIGLVHYEWEYDDPAVGLTDPEARDGNSVIPIGGLELAFGILLF